MNKFNILTLSRLRELIDKECRVYFEIFESNNLPYVTVYFLYKTKHYTASVPLNNETETLTVEDIAKRLNRVVARARHRRDGTGVYSYLGPQEN